MVGAEDDRYDNILLCLELLSHLCSRDFFSFDEPDSFEDSSSKLVLIGLDIIVPHIDVGTLFIPPSVIFTSPIQAMIRSMPLLDILSPV